MKRTPSIEPDENEAVDIELISKNLVRFKNRKYNREYSIDDILLIDFNFRQSVDFMDDSKFRYYSLINDFSSPIITLERNYKNKNLLRNIAESRRSLFAEDNFTICTEDYHLGKVYPMKNNNERVHYGNRTFEDVIFDTFLDKPCLNHRSNNDGKDMLEATEDAEDILNLMEEDVDILESLQESEDIFSSLQDNENILDLLLYNNLDNENADTSLVEKETNNTIDRINNSDSDIEYLEMDEELVGIKRNINKIKSEIKRVDSKRTNKEMLFFIDKCIECKENITDIYLDIVICPNTYNVNLGSRIYSLMKVNHDSDLTIFDALQSLCILTEDLQTFMKSYKVLQITGIIIHPLTKIKEISSIDKYVIVTNILNIDLGIDSQIVRTRKILGLRNLGNTCFMNSSLQAIINCKEFSDYFYSASLASIKKLSASFSELVRNFDGCKNTVVPYNFRNVIGKCVDIYNDNNEQDAMEFITDLLDIIHEELKIKKRSKSLTIDGYQKWQIENQSIVTNLFFIKLKSSIVCSKCNTSRSVFEPCLYLPVPVPLKKKYFDNIVIFYDAPNRVPLKIFADVSLTIYELKVLLKTEYNVAEEILCCQINNNTMISLDDFVLLRSLKNTLFCYEYVKDNLKEYFWMKISKKYFLWNTYLDFWILGKAKENDLNDKKCILDTLKLKLIPLMDQTRTHMLYESLNNIFQIEIDKKGNNTDDILYRPQIKLLTSHSNFNKTFGYNFDPIKDMIHLTSDKVDLKTCINDFLEREYIFGDDTQLCDGCNQYTVHFKDTELERLPKYLIIQLKRFRFTGIDFEKVDTFVDFDLGVFYINSTKYKVISIINHIAPSTSYAFRSIGSNGHYTSYVRYQDEWYLCNDESVTKVDSVRKDNAYIFVLERLD